MVNKEKINCSECEEKASIVGMKLSLDLGKNFDAGNFEILGYRACSGEIYDEKPRLWEGVERGERWVN